MKRHCLLAMLMLLSTYAYAGNSISFVVGGHRVHMVQMDHQVPIDHLVDQGGAERGQPALGARRAGARTCHRSS